MILYINQTAAHVLDFLFIFIWAVANFQTICWLVAIRAVIHFGLKVASARHDMYGILFFISEQFHIFLASAQTVLSKHNFGVEQMNFEQMTIPPIIY